jgi:hypothetical protein
LPDSPIKLERDPRSIKYGHLIYTYDKDTGANYSIPIIPFFGQVHAALWRLGAGQRESSTGYTTRIIDEPTKYLGSEVQTLLLSKLAPAGQFVTNQLFADELGNRYGKPAAVYTRQGEFNPAAIGTAVLGSAPFSLQNFGDTVFDADMEVGSRVALAMLGFVVNVNKDPRNTYGLDIFPPGTEEAKELVRLGVSIKPPSRKLKSEDVVDGKRVVTKQTPDPRPPVDPKWYSETAAKIILPILRHPDFKSAEVLDQKEWLERTKELLSRKVNDEKFLEKSRKEQTEEIDGLIRGGYFISNRKPRPKGGSSSTLGGSSLTGKGLGDTSLTKGSSLGK